ncbi:hypothetical protein EW146_g2345 [Bondarzewia mesenterica]|uniref:Uncharacterized protein n=1 Tax=Bondarzewia mesenterica TaxID=1095465 RepID=A0A4S4M0X0_9AGAM|nr:hypothetical protein EW146_g2345 [Bondarzewia mesenterica]
MLSLDNNAAGKMRARKFNTDSTSVRGIAAADLLKRFQRAKDKASHLNVHAAAEDEDNHWSDTTTFRETIYPPTRQEHRILLQLASAEGGNASPYRIARARQFCTSSHSTAAADLLARIHSTRFREGMHRKCIGNGSRLREELMRWNAHAHIHAPKPHRQGDKIQIARLHAAAEGIDR